MHSLLGARPAPSLCSRLRTYWGAGIDSGAAARHQHQTVFAPWAAETGSRKRAVISSAASSRPEHVSPAQPPKKQNYAERTVPPLLGRPFRFHRKKHQARRPLVRNCKPVTCGDVDKVRSVRVLSLSAGSDADRQTRAEHVPNPVELIQCPSRIRGSWSFVQAHVSGHRL
jgi:hypothetical protein